MAICVAVPVRVRIRVTDMGLAKRIVPGYCDWLTTIGTEVSVQFSRPIVRRSQGDWTQGVWPRYA